MNTMYLRTHSIERIFEQLQQHLGGALSRFPDEYQLVLDNDRVRGVINGVYLQNNLTFLEYDVTFTEDTLLVSHTPTTNPIYFLYCAKGRLRHSFGFEGKKRTLNQFQTGIFSCDPSRDSALLFKKNEAVKGTVITVATTGETITEGHVDLLREKVLETFKPKEEARTFAYTGSYNLKIADQIQQLEAITQTGIVRNLLVKGIVHTVLALEIEQHEEDINNRNTKCGTLIRNEMEEIKELSDFIRNYPDRRFTIVMLARKSGLSPAKLQEGFKFLHNSTVTNYIRDVRLEYAEKLIKTTDLNISEIVYSVGLTSRSYFSKIFKEKYNCSPKFYQDNQLRAAVSV